jgi:hypothetical protein
MVSRSDGLLAPCAYGFGRLAKVRTGMSSPRPAFSAGISSFSAAFTGRAWPFSDRDDVALLATL